MIPPRSSATAKAARKILRPTGTLLLNTERTPKENAISVAIGMAIPLCIIGSDGQIRLKSSTGTIIPPHAPIIGRRALSLVESSPTLISLLISRPTARKNIAIRKSLMKSPNVRAWPEWLKRLKDPTEKETGRFHNPKYHPFKAPRLAKMRARMVKNIKTKLALTCFIYLLTKL